jgi:hypothetical protein
MIGMPMIIISGSTKPASARTCLHIDLIAAVKTRFGPHLRYSTNRPSLAITDPVSEHPNRPSPGQKGKVSGGLGISGGDLDAT